MKAKNIISTYPLSFPSPEKPYDGPTFDRSGHQVTMDEYRDQVATEERRSRPRSPEPPASNTGGKLTVPDSSNEVSLDWIRMSGPVAFRREALELMADLFGNPTFGTGRYFLNAGYHFGAAGLFFDHDEDNGRDHCVINIPGSSLNEITFDQAVALMDALLTMGFRATRLDLAVDLYTSSDLIRNITDSCLNGELCKARKFRPMHVQSGEELTGYGCNIGDRGKLGSGRYLRVYDKGLETKTKAVGQWVRWESELAHDCAHQVSMALVQSDNRLAVALAHSFGVCDFRESNGAKHLSRRPRCKWFQELIDTIEPERVVQTRTKSDLHSMKRWMQTAVLPKLETLSAATHLRMDLLLAELFGTSNPDPEHLEDPKVRSLCLETGTDPTLAMQRLGNRRLVMLTAEEGYSDAG